MYLITVAHQWICSQCGLASFEYPTEPTLRRAMFAAGWIELECIPVDGDINDLEYRHYCPKHVKEFQQYVKSHS